MLMRTSGKEEERKTDHSTWRNELLIPSSDQNHPFLAPINTILFRTNWTENLFQALINWVKH